MLKKRICVIGAGASGLVTVKELLHAGHDVTCYEKHDRVAGVFYYSATKGGAYDSTRLTVSNYFMAFSSLPPNSDETRDYWRWSEYSDYLERFADHFNLRPHIELNHTVEDVDLLEAGNITVRTSNPDGLTAEKTFDHVVVCTGTNQHAKNTDIPGIDTFTGEVVHSSTYKNADPYADKKVVCVGIGETGADVAHEISSKASSCTLSVRHYQALTQRYPYGRRHTNDAYTSNALYSMPSAGQNWTIAQQVKYMLKFGKTKHVKEFARWNAEAGDYTNHFLTKTDCFLENVVNGQLGLNVGGIERLDGDSVVFNDGTKEVADVIVLSTGYRDRFDFLPEAHQPTDMRALYLHMFTPQLRDRVTFIGWARPAVGGVPTCSELQARYLARICAGKISLPERNELDDLIADQIVFEEHMYRRSPGIRTLVHYGAYVNNLADILGCSPLRLESLRDPRLMYKIWFGSMVPYMFRLYGEDSNYEEARAVIMNLEIGTNPLERIALVPLSISMRLLAKLGVMKGDPIYQQNTHQH